MSFCCFTGQIPGGMVPMYPPGTTQAQILAGTVRPTHYAIGNQLYQIVQQRGQFMLQPVQQPNKPVSNFNQVEIISVPISIYYSHVTFC